jgi:hypothetical protein
MAYDFPSSPTTGQVYQNYTWDGEKWAIATPASAALLQPKKNYIINGAMMVSQENGSTASSASLYYPVDQFLTAIDTTGVASVAKVTSATPGGSPNRVRVTVTSTDTSIGATEYYLIVTRIEGLRTADLRQGTVAAKTVTLRFGVKAPAGTYSVVFTNAAVNRTYVAEYVISGGEANTDVVKTVTIPLDQTGTWLIDNGQGLNIYWTLAVGSTFALAPGSWAGAHYLGSSNQFNFMGTVGNVFELFDVSLTEGTTAPSFVVPDYPSELRACQRYWRKFGGTTAFDIFFDGYCASGSLTVGQRYSHAGMRATPTWAVVGTFSSTNVSGAPVFNAGPDDTQVYVASTAAGTTRYYNSATTQYFTASARL